MFNLKEWLGSKKTKDMLSSQAAIAAVTLGVVVVTKGDPQKIEAVLTAIDKPLMILGGLGGLGLLGRAGVDTMKAAKEKPKKPRK